MSDAPASVATRPRGPDEVRAAVVAAATELFAERPPGAVTVREIAGRANVNHALVHRYFGSKEDMLRAVLEHHAGGAERAAAALPAAPGVDDIIDFGLEHPGYLRAFLAVQLADEWNDEVIPEALPLLRGVTDALAAEQRARGLRDPAVSAPMAASAIAAMLASWCAAGPWLSDRAGITERQAAREVADLRVAARAIWDRALQER